MLVVLSRSYIHLISEYSIFKPSRSLELWSWCTLLLRLCSMADLHQGWCAGSSVALLAELFCSAKETQPSWVVSQLSWGHSVALQCSGWGPSGPSCWKVCLAPALQTDSVASILPGFSSARCAESEKRNSPYIRKNKQLSLVNYAFNQCI